MFTAIARPRVLLALPAALVAFALAGPPSQAATLTPVTASPAVSGPSAQGIIMSDGRICDPIRHIGC